MTSTLSQPVTLNEIALRKTQRGLITGASGSGKSTLSEFLIPQFAMDYPKSRILVVDTKPRFKAEWTATGMPAEKVYKKWDHGAHLANSMLLPLNSDPSKSLRNVWRHGRVALCQTTGDERDIGWAIQCIKQFLSEARTGRPQLVYVDEGLDFFHTNAVARGGSDAILRCARAGRERGLSLLFGTQRPKGIPVQIKSEMTKLYLFRLDYAKDVAELRDMGYPGDKYPAPTKDHLFRLWDKSTDATREVAPLMKLKV